MIYVHVLLGQMFFRCFIINENLKWKIKYVNILVLITVKKSSLRLLIFFVKKMRVLIS